MDAPDGKVHLEQTLGEGYSTNIPYTVWGVFVCNNTRRRLCQDSMTLFTAFQHALSFAGDFPFRNQV